MFFCRYVYRFVCDLQSLLGYSPAELHAMVDLQPGPSESEPSSTGEGAGGTPGSPDAQVKREQD